MMKSECDTKGKEHMALHLDELMEVSEKEPSHHRGKEKAAGSHFKDQASKAVH